MINPHKIQAKVSKVLDHGDGVYTVSFEVDQKYLRFKAGQFLHLTLDPFDPTNGYWPESRVFSICSPPKVGPITIVYSVKGIYTKQMEQELSLGKHVWLKFPYGEFIIDSMVEPQDHVVLIAGGTGISPFIPFIQSLDDSSQYSSVSLFYGIRNRVVQLFESELVHARTNCKIFRPWIFNQQEENGSYPIPHVKGMLSIDGVRTRLDSGRFVQSKFFLSGPPVMIQYFKEDLAKQGIENNNIFIDSWE